MTFPAWMKIPASRTATELALALAVVQLAGLLWAVIWLAGVIAYQQEIIRYLAPWLR